MLRACRIEAGLSVREMAGLAHVSQVAVRRMERGGTRRYHAATIQRVVQTLVRVREAMGISRPTSLELIDSICRAGSTSKPSSPAASPDLTEHEEVERRRDE